jgi:antirestriction protein ArdC
VNPVAGPTSQTRAGYDRDQAEAARQATLETMHTQLAEKVGSLDSLQAWGSWLRFANSFHRYSFNNTLLIWAQKPDATMVAGYRAWQAKGRQVRRGETSIKVYGPVTTREPKTDPNGHPIRDADGKPVHEVRIVGVKPVSVFDVSQTEGEALPTPPQASLLTGQAPDGLWNALQSFVEAQGYTVGRGDCGDANGFTVYETRHVRVREDVDDAQAVKTLAHEAGHVLLHHPEQREEFSCRGIVEVEAESVAYMVTAAHGLDASQYTFNYVAGWAHNAATPGGPSVEEIVKATGARVIGATDRILQATQPVPTLVDEALADLSVEVTRPFDNVTAADRPPGVASPGVARGERVEVAAPDGAARARQALPRQGVTAYSVSR